MWLIALKWISNPKIIAGIIITAILGYFIFTYQHYKSEVVEQEAQIVELQTNIKMLVCFYLTNPTHTILPLLHQT